MKTRLILASVTSVALTLVAAGCTITAPGAVTDQRSLAADINNDGLVVGTLRGDPARGFWDRPFVAQPGQRYRELVPLDGSIFSHATAVNDAGTVIGYSTNGSGNDSERGQAFRWSEREGPRALPVTADQPVASAHGINEDDVIVGAVKVRGDNRLHASVWLRGATEPIRLPLPAGGTSAEALDVNERGQIVGWFDTGGQRRAILWEPAGESGAWIPVVLSCPDQTRCVATALNDAGTIVGHDLSPAVWKAGTHERVNPTSSRGIATDINNNGVIVGHGGAQASAWLPRPDGTYEMRTYGPIGSPQTINTSGWAVNDHGDLALTILSDGALLVGVRRSLDATG